ELLAERGGLGKSIDHIREVVAMQQSYARVSGVIEPLPPAQLVEDALRINTAALDRHRVEIVRDFADVPPVAVDKHKVLQILINLISNAKYAVIEVERQDRRITLRIDQRAPGQASLYLHDNLHGHA